MPKTEPKTTTDSAKSNGWGELLSAPEPIPGFVRVGRGGTIDDIPEPIRAAFDHALEDGGTFRVRLDDEQVIADFKRLFKRYGRLLGDPVLRVRVSVHPPYVDYRVTRDVDTESKSG